MAHFENELEVLEASSNDQVAIAKSNVVALAKSKCVDGNNNEERLKDAQELYESHFAEQGEEGAVIRAGRNCAVSLKRADRGGEAMELLTKLLATSKQVLVLIIRPQGS